MAERVPCPEFDCCECRRHIIMFCGALPVLRLCATCVAIPGWFKHPEVRQMIDPDHDGRDPADSPEQLEDSA